MAKRKEKAANTCRKRRGQVVPAEKEGKEMKAPGENSSPVCYADSLEMMPEYRLESYSPQKNEGPTP